LPQQHEATPPKAVKQFCSTLNLLHFLFDLGRLKPLDIGLEKAPARPGPGTGTDEPR